MALDTYSALQTAVASWLSRVDIGWTIVDAIALAEAQMQRELRNRRMEQRATTTAAEYLALPDDFWELRRIGANGRELTLFNPGVAARYSTTGAPKYYTVEANQIRFVPAPDSTYTVEVDYWRRIPALSATVTSNWVLVDHPDLYLTGAQAWTLMLLQNDERAQAMCKLFTGLIAGTNSADRKARWSGTPMATVPA